MNKKERLSGDSPCSHINLFCPNHDVDREHFNYQTIEALKCKQVDLIVILNGEAVPSNVPHVTDVLLYSIDIVKDLSRVAALMNANPRLDIYAHAMLVDMGLDDYSYVPD